MKHQNSTAIGRKLSQEKSKHAYGVVLLLPAAIAGLAMTTTNSELGNIIFAAVADAYIQVSTFVAGTFLIFYSIEKFLKIDASATLRRDTIWQVPVAAALGALPGCGGAIIVVTQYVTGRLSFGSVVAVLTATMGDAAFLLIVQEPLTGMAIIVMGFAVGTLSGWSTNLIHGSDFLRDTAQTSDASSFCIEDASTPWIDSLWILIMVPGFFVGVLVAFQIDVDALFASTFFHQPATFIGVVGGVLALTMRLAPKFSVTRNAVFSDDGAIIRRTIANTNYVTFWVICAFLVFELSVYLFELDLKNMFTGVALYTPLVSILIGFLPGCGPQVLVTTMYLSGIIPLSAQIGNAISNDGDALFPAIAIAPRVAILATLYSALPALVISYGWLFLVEGP